MHEASLSGQGGLSQRAEVFVLYSHNPLRFPLTIAKQPGMLDWIGLGPAKFRPSAAHACEHSDSGTSVIPCFSHVVVGASCLYALGAGAGAGTYGGNGGGMLGFAVYKVNVLSAIVRSDDRVKFSVFLPFDTFTATGWVSFHQPTV